MTRDEARAAYAFAFGRESICNGWELDAILDHFDQEIDEEDLVIEAMADRAGTPSPRGPTTFERLPKSNADVFQSEFDLMTHVPDVKDVPKLKRYIAIRYKLHEANDAWLVNNFVERFRTGELAT